MLVCSLLHGRPRDCQAGGELSFIFVHNQQQSRPPNASFLGAQIFWGWKLAFPASRIGWLCTVAMEMELPKLHTH